MATWCEHVNVAESERTAYSWSPKYIIRQSTRITFPKLVYKYRKTHDRQHSICFIC